MTTLERVDDTDHVVLPADTASIGSGGLIRVAPHIVVWTLLIAPMIKSMARGWRPLADDATIAIGAWRALSLHPPLVGQLTSATGGPNTSDPGPLEYWLLGPFAHLDPGQGLLLGSAVLCALILSVAIDILWRNVGAWASIIFSLVMVDLAITSPTPFVDPVWNNSFGFFWFAAFLAVAFVVCLGNLRYFPLLLFIGSVALDSNLLYLPTIALLLVATLIGGWFAKRPSNYRWLGWTAGVAVVCWVGPLYQQFFEARPNLSLLMKSSGLISGGKVPKTEGWGIGIRALSRAASPNPIWTSPRSIDALGSYADIASRNPLVGFSALLLLIVIAVVARRHHKGALFSMSIVALGGSFGVVALFARTPANDVLAFIWVNLALWLVGISIWLTIGFAIFTAIQPQLGEIRTQVYEVRAQLGRKQRRFSDSARRTAVLLILGIACLAGTLVTVFPYGNQFLLDFPGVNRVKHMTADIETHVPRGDVGLGISYTGTNYFQQTEDEHGIAYLLLTRGWTPGLESSVNQLLGLPIKPKAPFVVFTERGPVVTGARYYPHYKPFWYVKS